MVYWSNNIFTLLNYKDWITPLGNSQIVKLIRKSHNRPNTQLPSSQRSMGAGHRDSASWVYIHRSYFDLVLVSAGMTHSFSDWFPSQNFIREFQKWTCLDITGFAVFCCPSCSFVWGQSSQLTSDTSLNLKFWWPGHSLWLCISLLGRKEEFFLSLAFFFVFFFSQQGTPDH